MHKNMDEGIRYILVGVLTTLVNYIFYGGFDFLFEKIGVASVISYKLAYGVAFVAAVLFAFFANKYMVFRKKGESFFKRSCLSSVCVWLPELQVFFCWFFW